MCYACNLGLKKTFSAYLPCFDEIEIASKVIGGARNRAGICDSGLMKVRLVRFGTPC